MEFERARVPQRYDEARDVLLQALTSDVVNFSGEHFSFSNVEIVMRPFQQAASAALVRRCQPRFDRLGRGE